MSLYALGQRTGESYDAAGKAMRDVFTVLASKGSKTIWNMPKKCNKYLKALDLPYLAGFLLLFARKKDFVFYAIPENHIKVKILKKLQRLKKYKMICFINDANAFRYGNDGSAKVKEERKREVSVIGMADYVLVPNPNMAKLLQENGVTSRLISVGVWDYLMSPEQVQRVEQVGKREAPELKKTVHIAFAGNLNKSGFLLRMKPFDQFGGGIQLELWGKLDGGKIEELPPFAEYHGVLLPDDVPGAIATMDYGLVWDGVGTDEVEGELGKYLQYNNSHKCGLYLASGLPVIVWKKSGMAVFVEKYGCGICVERLGEIPGKLEMVDYNELKRNVKVVSDKLRRGGFLSEALDMVLVNKL